MYLANNVIASLVGCEGLDKLKFLHLRRNKIEKIEEEGLPDLPALEYLNLRSNKIPDLDNLHRLIEKYFESLQDLNVINCQVELDQSSMNIFIAEVLKKKQYPKIKRFCKVEITDAHRFESIFYAQYLYNKEMEEKKRREEEERRKQEEEEQNA